MHPFYRFVKKPLTAMLALTLVLLLITPLSALASVMQPIPPGAAITLSAPGLYNIATATNGAVITVTTNGVGLTGTHGDLSVVIGAGVTLSLVNATITGTGTGNPLRAGGLTCGLVLVGNNAVTARTGSGLAGVGVPNAASLTISGPGSLEARGAAGADGGGAGIGGNEAASSGAITIQHATVRAYGAGGAAGIGGGAENSSAGGNGGPVTLINASVLAQGSTISVIIGGGGGAGIGGGGTGNDDAGHGQSITITASAVRALGGNSSGIGGGGAGIGGGGCSVGFSTAGNGQNITIDAASSVFVQGGAGTHGSVGPFSYFGGGGAGVGGGGGSSSNGGQAVGPIVLGGGILATGSTGGLGGTDGSSTGGAGALCGNGGDSAATNGPPVTGTDGASFDLGGGTYASATGPAVDLTSRPSPAYLGYPSLPLIATQPSATSALAGGNAAFLASASGGTAPYTYQWQRLVGGVWTDLADGGLYSGASTNTLALAGVSLAENGSQYRLVAYDFLWRSVTSNAAPLAVTVQPPTPPQPPSKLPRTGDSFPLVELGAAILVMGVALAGTGWLTLRRRVQR